MTSIIEIKNNAGNNKFNSAFHIENFCTSDIPIILNTNDQIPRTTPHNNKP